MSEIHKRTKTGFMLHRFFTSIDIQGFITTDINQVYYLPDGTQYSRQEDIEDWIIRMSEQIKSERNQIIIENSNIINAVK